MTTLYEHWLEVARQNRSEIACVDCAAERHWTFAQLAAWADRSAPPSAPIVYPQGHSADFIHSLLGAWRWHKLVCPLEPGGKPPVLPLPPAPCRHLKLTSASTGLPRVIGFTGPQLLADAQNLVSTMGLRADWPNLGAISMAHSYGFSNLVLPLLLHGIPLILAPSPMPEMVRKAMEGFAQVTLAGVPALWRAWDEAGALSTRVRLAISAGAPLPVSLEQNIYEHTGVKIHNFYGASECGGIAYDRGAEPRRDNGYVGQAVARVELSVNADGCLCVRSQAVGETYWPEPDRSLGNGVFQSSDLAELREGHVYLHGRLNEQINVAGRKVSPGVIERALGQHPAIKECLVFGVPSNGADRAETIVACIAPEAAASAGELKQFLLNCLPAWQVPREWWFVDSIGTNVRGKVSRKEWRQHFLENQKSVRRASI